MKQKIFSAGNDYTGLVLRLVIAILLFPHGAQKLAGSFGGYGFAGTMNYFTDTLHLPWLVGFSVILIEFIAPFFLLAGFASRLWSVAIIAIMIGTILCVHGQYGFFMDWGNTLHGEGFEYHLLMIGAALALTVNGSGNYSLDKAISGKR